jgi:quinolinate synthase
VRRRKKKVRRKIVKTEIQMKVTMLHNHNSHTLIQLNKMMKKSIMRRMKCKTTKKRKIKLSLKVSKSMLMIRIRIKRRIRKIMKKIRRMV